MRVDAWKILNRMRIDRGNEIRRTRHPERLMHPRKLIDRDSSRLEQPAKIGGKIGDSRFQKDPSASVVHVPETHERGRARAGRCVVQERCEVGVGINVPRSNQCGGFGEPRRLLLVSPDGRDCRELVERLVQRDR
jgi:hypothetical protein